LRQLLQRLIPCKGSASRAFRNLFFGLPERYVQEPFFMPSSQSDWDAKHRLVAEAPSLRAGEYRPRTLAAAAGWPGAGHCLRHGKGMPLFLASRGQHVTAVDFFRRCSGHFGSSRHAAWVLQCAAGKASMKLGGLFRGGPRVDTDGPGAGGVSRSAATILILCIQFLQRSLFSTDDPRSSPGWRFCCLRLTRALQLEFPGGPRNPAYLSSKTGELREAFPELSVMFYYRELCARAGNREPGRKEAGKAGLKTNCQ